MTSKVSARASQPSTPVNFEVPAHACDCHTHIHGDPDKFPFFAGRRYTPEPASPEEMAALHKALHTERVVIVTPSVYGTDNSSSLFGMKARGATARGVAVIDDKTTEAELDAMQVDGFCGIRINLATSGIGDPNVGRALFTAAAERMKSRGWHVQLYTKLPMISAIKDRVTAAPVPAVFDHFGGLEASLGLEQPGFSDLLELVKSGKAYVKIWGSYRSSKLAPDYQDMVPFARALIAANADRIVWGTDWPHPDSSLAEERKATDIAPLYQIDGGRLLNQLPVWAAGCRNPQQDSGRQSSAALRILMVVLPASVLVQPARGFAETAEREQMEGADRRRRGPRCGHETAHDLVRPGLGEQPAIAADLIAYRADRIADAAAECELHQHRGAGKTREADYHGKIDGCDAKFAQPVQDRRRFKAKLRDDIDSDLPLTAPAAPCRKRFHRLCCVEVGMPFRMAGDADS
jgi:predicted TIM-barrel fold metal-dependent hydrolase